MKSCISIRISLLLFPILAIAGLNTPAQAQAPSHISAGYKTIQEDTLRSDLNFLASDSLEGRLSLQTGDNVAIQWIASEFAKAGLKPAANGSYLQPVPLIEYRPDRTASYVSLDRGGKEIRWKFPEAYGSFKEDVHVAGNVIFAGYGITAPELGYDDYAYIDVHGRVVLIFDHEPQENDPKSIFNGTGNTRYATTRVKVLNAQSHGAAAVLIVAEPNRRHPSNQERVARIGGSAARAVPLPQQAIAEDELHIPSATISDDVARTLLQVTGVRGGDLQEDIDKNLKPHSLALQDTKVTIHFHNSQVSTGTTYNVAGLLEGSSSALKEDTILISAHHDHDGKSGQEIWHGADDNGSGTVGVVALAHAFAANKAKPKRSILFVVFAAEERGLLGSFWMASHPLRPIETTRAMINFDMIGRDEQESDQTKGLITVPPDTSNRLNLIGAMYSPDYAKVVQQENRRVGLVLDDRFDHEAALNIFFRSDQFPFVLKNVPAFWWFTGFHPDYHHTTDTADKIDYQKMAKILRLAYLSAWHFTDDRSTPQFVEAPKGR